MLFIEMLTLLRFTIQILFILSMHIGATNLRNEQLLTRCTLELDLFSLTFTFMDTIICFGLSCHLYFVFYLSTAD